MLDDVWTEDHNKWEPLRNSLRCGGTGSKILVTTRNERVMIMMGSRDNVICHLGQLSNENCWLLLCLMTFSGRNEVEFEESGKKIAKKYNVLPLAAKTLGSLLRFKSSLEDVLPKDFEIDVERLIENWMALGYLGSNVSDMELKGRECFDVLAMRSMFKDLQIDDALDMEGDPIIGEFDGGVGHGNENVGAAKLVKAAEMKSTAVEFKPTVGLKRSILQFVSTPEF
ncbi:hypothetical protein ACS0TY_021202 [Phlomoides rotata]